MSGAKTMMIKRGFLERKSKFEVRKALAEEGIKLNRWVPRTRLLKELLDKQGVDNLPQKLQKLPRHKFSEKEKAMIRKKAIQEMTALLSDIDEITGKKKRPRDA